jgi:hypothetical protein
VLVKAKKRKFYYGNEVWNMITKAKVKIPQFYCLTNCEEFKHYVGRYPNNIWELKRFAKELRKEIERLVAWEIVGKRASKNFERDLRSC